MRWRLRLLDFQYDIQYRPGKTNLNADALSRNPVDRTPCAKALPILGELKRKRGRPRKVTTSPAPKTHAVTPDLSDNLGIADRVKKRRRPADVPPTYSYSSDDEIDHCDLVKKKTRKRAFKKRLVRFPDGSDYLPPQSEVSLKPAYSNESCISTGEAPGCRLLETPAGTSKGYNYLHPSSSKPLPVVVDAPDRHGLPSEVADENLPQTIFLPPIPEFSDLDSNDSTLCGNDETIIQVSANLDDTLREPMAQSTPARSPLIRPLQTLSPAAPNSNKCREAIENSWAVRNHTSRGK